MKIVNIFADFLYSVKFCNNEEDEFQRLFELWQDVEFLEKFFEENKNDLQNGFYGSISVDEAVIRTKNEATRLEKKLLKIFKQKKAGEKISLDEMFQPLDYTQCIEDTLSKTKVKGNLNKSWLRIYAIKVDRNYYIVTGGAIKLTAKMAEREHTANELKKLDKCRDFLKELGIFDAQGLLVEL